MTAQPSQIFWVYTTAPSSEIARELGKMVVERRLAACVNVIHGMESMYWWEGKVQSETEAVLIAKTSTDRYPELEAAIVRAHPYECPCVVAVPVQRGFDPFLQWVKSTARNPSSAL